MWFQLKHCGFQSQSGFSLSSRSNPWVQGPLWVAQSSLQPEPAERGQGTGALGSQTLALEAMHPEWESEFTHVGELPAQVTFFLVSVFLSLFENWEFKKKKKKTCSF